MGSKVWLKLVRESSGQEELEGVSIDDAVMEFAAERSEEVAGTLSDSLAGSKVDSPHIL